MVNCFDKDIIGDNYTSRSLLGCRCQYGDVFALPFKSQNAQKCGLNNQYLLIQMIDKTEWYPSYAVPLVYLKITKTGQLPKTMNEYNQAIYIQTLFTKYENRFFPVDFSNPQQDIYKKSQIKYVTDEYGYLPHYRLIIIVKRKKELPTDLLYIGNYAGSSPPKNEFIPHSVSNIDAISINNNNLLFEEAVLKKYKNYNCRESAAYSSGMLH